MEKLPFLAPVAADLERVDATIRARLGSEVALVRQVAEYIIAGGGKRLRPALVLLSAGAAGYPGKAGPPPHLQLATAVVLNHTPTPLYENVVGASDPRRGRQTAHVHVGTTAPVLRGGFP